jgi:hypothetical protein
MTIRNQVLLPLDVKGFNGRFYSYSSIQGFLKDLQDRSARYSLFGEWLEAYSEEHQSSEEIDVLNVSHAIKNLRFDTDKNCLIGDIEVLNTAKGKLLRKELLEGTTSLSVAQRSLLGEDGVEIINVIGYDILPSKKVTFSQTALSREKLDEIYL